jgi:hypothetical protein
MSFLNTVFLIALIFFAAVMALGKESPQGTAVTITAERVLGTFDWETGKLRLQKGVEVEDVVKELIREAATAHNSLKTCEAKPNPASTTKKSDTKRDKK